MTSVRVDRAVRRIKALPKNRNVSAPRQTYKCGICRFPATSLAEAFMHSMDHGPWPACDDGTILNLDPVPDLCGTRYNRGEHLVALSGGPNVRRIV